MSNLINSYYAALNARDFDKLADLVDVLTDEKKQDINNEGIGYSYVTVYSKTGLTKNSYVVYATYSWQKQGMTYLEQVKKCRDGLSLLAERAENLGVTLVLENHNDVCRFADELIPLIQEIGSPALKTNPDPFNFGRDDRTRTCLVNQMVFEQTRLMMPLAENIHFKLTKFREDGSDINMNVPVFMDLFREYDYDGWIAVEFMWPDREKDVDLYQEIRNGAALIRRSL